jgi:N6-adenosine-specific RNA methylase IME4
MKMKQAKPMRDETTETYGRLLEDAHIGGYVIERLFKFVEFLLTDNRWQTVGAGFEHPDDFMASLKFDNVKMLAEQRKKLTKLIKAAMPKVTQRVMAKSLGVGQRTVGRDLESNDSKNAAATRESDSDFESNDSNLDLSGAEAAALVQRKNDRERSRSERTTSFQPLPAGQFRLIYADPPWQYEHSVSESRAVENQYPTMTLDALFAMQIPAADDCVLFLWATSPKLAEAMRLIEAWQFDYRTCAVWDKQVLGMGYYFRQQHELLLVAARGSAPIPEPSVRVSSVFKSKRGKHSEKPEMAYQILEKMYPSFTDHDKVELFARKARRGWFAWGNEGA